MKHTLFALSALTVAAAAQEPTLRSWDDYQVIMWVGDSAYKQPDKLPLFWQRLRELGVTAGMVHGAADPQPLLDAKMPYYVENMVNKGLCLKWNSNVRDWDKFVTAWKGPRDEAGCVREYSFDDPEWRGWARTQMASLVKKNAPNAPLLYDIRDELSVTQSANPFDYDFSPTALAGFRKWLETQYGSLEKLNAQWETQFKTWGEVKPFTTDRMKNRMASGEALPRGKPDWQAVQALKLDPAKPLAPLTRWNFSPWADHRTYMDVSLAGMLDDLRKTARGLDPRTPVGIEGTQMASAFGGYDLWKMSQALDWVEPYDICGSRAIFGSFMPGKTFLCTVGESDAVAARRRLWHLLLRGDKGCIIWWSEDCIDWKSADYALTARAKALAPVFKELRTPLARLFLHAQRETDAIAIHYSHPSVQAAWMLESTEDGSTWLRRFSSYEASHNKHAKHRMGWLRAIENAGFTPVFLSTEQIERGDLAKFRAFAMPQSYAVSDAEATAIEKWMSGESRTLLADAYAGLFDGRCRLREKPALPPSAAPDFSKTETSTASAWLLGKLGGWKPEVQVPAEAGIRVQRYRADKAQLVAFEQNRVYEMGDDLKDKGTGGSKPVTTTAKLADKKHAYDLRTGKYLGQLDALPLTISPDEPSLIALAEEKLPGEDPVAALSESTTPAKTTPH